MKSAKLTPPRTWRQPERHFLAVLEDPWYRLLFALQDEINYSTAVYWRELGVRSMHLPVTTDSVSSPMGLGSDSSPVQIDLFGRKTYLTDSMQFLLEYGCRAVGTGAYYIMPSFRGEDPDQTHLNQFFHSEAELPGGLDECIVTIEDYLRFLCEAILSNHESGIRLAAGGTEHIQAFLDVGKLPTVPLAEAIEIVGDDVRCTSEIVAGTLVLTRFGERKLLDHFRSPVWVSEPDHVSVPFYQAFHSGDSSKAIAADLLLGSGEVVGAGERHPDADALLKSIYSHQVNLVDYGWYIEMKRKYPLRTSGFGVGIERFIMWLLNHPDIRDIVTFPRMKGHLSVP